VFSTLAKAAAISVSTPGGGGSGQGSARIIGGGGIGGAGGGSSGRLDCSRPQQEGGGAWRVGGPLRDHQAARAAAWGLNGGEELLTGS